MNTDDFDPTEDHFSNLPTTDQESDVRDDIYVMDVPCCIRLKNPEQTLVVEGIGQWAWTEQGVYATGRWSDQLKLDDEVTVLIPEDNIAYITQDFKALAEADVS